MCGIAGVQLKADSKVDEKTLTAMGRLLDHRGPDHFGIFIHNNVGVAHNRLSILDLSDAGNQPFQNERYVLNYNGEIYNYLNLKEKLLKIGVTFSSTSDTAVLFEYLVRFGIEQTVKEIEGMFAFSFCDLQNNTVYLCRDRFGIKPLVWKSDDKGLYWASEAKALSPFTKLKPDPLKSLHAITSIGDHSNYYTVFQGVQHVAPGSYLICKNGTAVQEVQYYDPAAEVDEKFYNELKALPFDRIVAEFNTLLEQSVRKMLMSDIPMGVFVSGGIDSSIVALWASKHAPDLTLFTADVVGKYSEYEDALLLSKTINKPLHSFRFHAEMMLSDWAKATYHYECPIVTHTNAVPFASVSKLAHSHGIKSVLTGEGSDELFLGYPQLHAKRLIPIAKLSIDIIKRIYSFVPGLNRHVFQENGSVHNFIDLLLQQYERQRLREKGLKAYHFLPENQIREHYLTIQMLKEHLLSLLHRNDRMGMLASIESRFPFLDEAMVRFAVNLPVNFKRSLSLTTWKNKIPLLMDKRVVRSASRQHLPEKLTFKRKNGFPMYGHKHIRVQNGYFKDGYVASVVGLSNDAEEYMLRTQDAYYLAKLVSVDIFGRLFEMGESSEKVTERLLSKITIVPE